MDGGSTDNERSTMLRAAVAKVSRDELKAALDRTANSHVHVPKPIGNALNALRKHRDPSAVVATTPYRAALPFVAAAIADPCLERTIEVLGDHADDPTRDQLDGALVEVGTQFPATTVAVMLASVAADAGLPASDLCFELLTNEERFGLTDGSEPGVPSAPRRDGPKSAGGVTPEQRQERRLRKQRDAEDRRRRQESARKAGEQARRARRKERSENGGGPHRAAGTPDRPPGGVAPRLTRRALLTPVQEEEFDRQDPWVAGVVFAWVPFAEVDPTRPDVAGKVRPCVVIAGSATHLLVRPGYSEGGVKSRDWRSVPLRHWRRFGFDQPTWIDIEVLAVPRQPDQAPVGWLSPDDWNSLW
jgi:hypothetical protein